MRRGGKTFLTPLRGPVHAENLCNGNFGAIPHM